MAKSVDLGGKKFHRLLVDCRGEDYISPLGEKKKRYNCLCDCGTRCLILAARLSRGTTKSCGCLKEEVGGKASITHGMTDTPTYRSWASMLSRCNNENDYMYTVYGGSGITVCREWHTEGGGFIRFLTDMGERPEGCTLNRVKGAKTYSKQGCEWSTLSVQSFDQKRKSTNTSGRTGVYRLKSGNWMVLISEKGVTHNLGTFDSFDLACEMREFAEMSIYGITKE
jgi:hypothetical protein